MNKDTVEGEGQCAGWPVFLREQPLAVTLVFLPGESQGQRSLVGCRLWGRTVIHNWSDLAAAACPIAVNGHAHVHIAHSAEAVRTLVCLSRDHGEHTLSPCRGGGRLFYFAGRHIWDLNISVREYLSSYAVCLFMMRMCFLGLKIDCRHWNWIDISCLIYIYVVFISFFYIISRSVG